MIKILAVYLVTAVLAAGATNAYFKREAGHDGSPVTWADKQHAYTACGRSFAFGLGGPLSLVAIAFMSGGFVYGFDWSCNNYSGGGKQT